ncbi:MAG: hypothetical protein ABJH07_05075 [Sedimentitalea sp.]|uniref:MotE family protein n=1 Tax=Sedimentitalea sp. TaxID=2048915 RepID=UPI003263A7D8
MTAKSGSPRVRFGALAIISVLLIGSALVRLGLQAGPAFAREAPLVDDTDVVVTTEVAHAAPSSAEMQTLIEAFQHREHALDTREAQIQDRMKALEIAEEAIGRRLEALIGAEERLSATLALADGATEEDLVRLTNVYEKMKPKQAAALFEAMAPEFAAGFLARMRPDAAASVMAGLSPMAAYSISVVLAGRNASVPKE